MRKYQIELIGGPFDGYVLTLMWVVDRLVLFTESDERCEYYRVDGGDKFRYFSVGSLDK